MNFKPGAANHRIANWSDEILRSKRTSLGPWAFYSTYQGEGLCLCEDNSYPSTSLRTVKQAFSIKNGTTDPGSHLLARNVVCNRRLGGKNLSCPS